MKKVFGVLLIAMIAVMLSDFSHAADINSKMNFAADLMKRHEFGYAREQYLTVLYLDKAKIKPSQIAFGLAR